MALLTAVLPGRWEGCTPRTPPAPTPPPRWALECRHTCGGPHDRLYPGGAVVSPHPASIPPGTSRTHRSTHRLVRRSSALRWLPPHSHHPQSIAAQHNPHSSERNASADDAASKSLRYLTCSHPARVVLLPPCCCCEDALTGALGVQGGPHGPAGSASGSAAEHSVPPLPLLSPMVICEALDRIADGGSSCARGVRGHRRRVKLGP